MSNFLLANRMVYSHHGLCFRFPDNGRGPGSFLQIPNEGIRSMSGLSGFRPCEGAPPERLLSGTTQLRLVLRGSMVTDVIMMRCVS